MHEDVTVDPAGNWAHGRRSIRTPLSRYLFLREGRFRASLFVNYRRPYRWSREEVTLVEDIAARTWDAVERAAAEDELRSSEGRKSFLLRLMKEGRETADPEKMMGALTDQAV